MRIHKTLALFAVLLCLFTGLLFSASEPEFNGQASGWLMSGGALDETYLGFRYIPALNLSHTLKNNLKLDAEAAYDIRCQTALNNGGDFPDNTDIEFYRFWVRCTRPQDELRLGRQKLNFGPAKILRTLRWFDRLDIRDTLQITEGADALLYRRYFPDNSNIWGWVIYGNEGRKGLEMCGSEEGRPEIGGRWQFPVPRGEMALSTHRRCVDKSEWNSVMSEPMSGGQEIRLAADGNWDIGPGLWFETAVEETDINKNSRYWRKLATVGADYTLESGIHLQGEHFIHSSGSKMTDHDDAYKISAVSADFVISLLDSITAIGYYNWKECRTYHYAGWQRKYDNWQFDISVFSSAEDSTSSFGGKGAQCLVTYNH
ncbi:MAG: hypothetical protein ABIJ15_06855 [bacterium]